MYTEAELRDALHHSAARVDDLVTAPMGSHAGAQSHRAEAVVAYPARTPAGTDRPHRWRTAVAAAAGVAAIGAATFMVLGTGSPSTDVPAAGPTTATSAADSPVPSSAPPHRSSAKIAVNNLVALAGRNASEYSFGPTGSPQVIMVGGDNAVDVIALPASASFDPATQIKSAQTVRVAGTTGYYGAVAAGVSGTDSKYGPQKATLAWQASNGTWIFVQGMNEGVNLSAATLLGRVQELGITAAPAPLPRIPFRVGWLPAGLTVTSVETQPGSAGTVVGLSSGSKTVTFNASARSAGAGTGRIDGTSPDDTSVQRSAGQFAITIHAHGYAQADTQKILDDLDLSKLASDPSSWWTLAEAFND